MKVKLDELAFMPMRAHETDAGLDLRSPDTVMVLGRGSAVIDTGVHVQLPKGTAGLLVSKSGLNINHGLLSTGLIDEGYTGSIRVKLYNLSDETYIVNEGDKISQLVIIPVVRENITVCSELDDSDRGDKGFGSSGR